MKYPLDLIELKDSNYAPRPDTLDFAVNTNPFGAPRSARNIAIREFSQLIGTYVSPQEHSVHGHLAVMLGINPETLTITCGASEAIFRLSEAFGVHRGMVFPPNFWEYRASIENAGATVLECRRSESHDFALPSQINGSEHIDIAFVGNPDNPTGQMVGLAALDDLAREIAPGVLVLDETYLWFRSDFANTSCSKIAASNSNLVVVGSLSKFFSIPALRIGYVIANPQITSRLRAAIICYGVGALSLRILEAALSDERYIMKTRAFIAAERERLATAINKLPIFELKRSEANFLFIKIRDGLINALKEHLARHRILVRWGIEIDPCCNHYFRMAIKSRRTNDVLLSVLREFSRCRPN